MASKNLSPWCCLVPAEVAGLVIGRGGSVVQGICQETGANIDISGDDDTPESLSDRIVTIWGTASEKEAACLSVVRITHRHQDAAENEDGIFVLVVPSVARSAIMGPEGSVVAKMASASGADVNISKSLVEGTDLQPISIEGTVSQTMPVIVQIGSIVQELATSGKFSGQSWPWRPSPPDVHAGSGQPRGRAGARRQSERSSRASNGTSVGSSSSVTPGRRGVAGTGGASSQGASSKAASSNRSVTPNRTRPALAGHSSSVHFVVSAPLAAWIVGKRGRSIESIRSGSGAFVEVGRSGGTSRLVEVRGSDSQREAAARLLGETIIAFPEGAPAELRLVLPAPVVKLILVSGSSVIQEIRDRSGAEVQLAEVGAGDGSRLLSVVGNPDTLLQALTMAAVRMASGASNTSPPSAPGAKISELRDASGVSRATSRGAPSSRGSNAGGGNLAQTSATRRRSPSAAYRDGSESRSRALLARSVSPSASIASGVATPSAASRSRSVGLGHFNVGAPGSVGSAASSVACGVGGAVPPLPPAAQLLRGSDWQHPAEAQLLRTLIAGPQPDGAKLQLALPSAFVCGPLLAEGRLRAVAERSGSKIELDAHYTPPPTQLLTISGSMLGNAMAILYIQELMQQVGVTA